MTWNLTAIPARVTERAITRVVEQADGCWISTYSTGSHGYAQIGWQENGRSYVVLAHRAAWTHVEGEVPPDMTLDHLCKKRTCVNPSHLRVLSNFDNARRTNGRDWPLGECIRGHSDDLLVARQRGPANGGGTRLMCSECDREDQRAYRLRKAA